MSRRQKISILIPDLRGGGAERVAINLANGFINRGYLVDIILLSTTGEFLNDLDPAIRLVEFRTERIRGALLPLASYLKRESPDALLAFMWPLTVLAIWAKAIVRANTRVVVTEHTTWSKDEIVQSRLAKLFVQATMHFSFPRADAVITVSKGAADDMARFARLDRDLIDVIYNPIVSSTGSISDKPCAPDAWWTGTHYRVLAVGSLKPIKDYPTLLTAFAALVRTKQARLLILGEGECRSELESLVKHLGLEEFVFMPGFIKDLTPYYKHAHLHVLCSSGEGFGNVIVEALSVGTPVVSTDCQSGPREILLNGEYGRLVQVGDAEGLTQSMIETLSISHDKERLILRSRDFSVDRAVNLYINYLFPGGECSYLP